MAEDKKKDKPERPLVEFDPKAFDFRPLDSLRLSEVLTASTSPLAIPGLTNSIPPSDLTWFNPLSDMATLQFRTGYQDLEKEITELRRKIHDQSNSLLGKETSAKKYEKQIQSLKGTIGELDQKQRLAFLLDRVNQQAQQSLLKSQPFQQSFLDKTERNAVVMAVDIRRSTELMLKARTPEAFSAFITGLCKDLMEIIKGAYGVVDKFTGDGVLAFFPDFYSGEDAAYNVIDAADKCHKSFDDHYQAGRRSFTAILKDVGLGIGIDYGKVHLVQIAGGLTVVGAPVVYACRLSGAPAGVTLLNQPAYELVIEKFAQYCTVTETSLNIKHEGELLAYEVKKANKTYSATVPQWLTETEIDKPES